MSEDSYREVTSESWFARIGNSIKGVLFGLVLLLVAFPLLFWNEGRAVKTCQALDEGGKAVVSIASDKVDAANNGKLVHVTGKAEADARLSDPVFGVSATALCFKRVVEMYQWKESEESKTEKRIGGGTETVRNYSYDKTWSDKLISSGSFKMRVEHQNPDSMPYSLFCQYAKDVTLGAFTLSAALVAMINNFEPLPVANSMELPESLRGKAVTHNGGIYVGANPSSPKVGDSRVRFEVARPAVVSLVACQSGDTFTPYPTKAGECIELLQLGACPADAMFKKARQDNTFLTNALRFGGFVLMFVGLLLMLKPLSVIADVLPILGNILGAGAALVSFLLASLFSSLTIAAAWIFYRPIIGISLIVIALGMAAAIAVCMGKSRASKSS